MAKNFWKPADFYRQKIWLKKVSMNSLFIDARPSLFGDNRQKVALFIWKGIIRTRSSRSSQMTSAGTGLTLPLSVLFQSRQAPDPPSPSKMVLKLRHQPRFDCIFNEKLFLSASSRAVWWKDCQKVIHCSFSLILSVSSLINFLTRRKKRTKTRNRSYPFRSVLWRRDFSARATL